MKRTTRRSSAPSAASTANSPLVPSGQLAWSHLGARYRVTAWPDAAFERLDGEAWRPVEPDDAALASAALGIDAPMWRRYLEFVPAVEADFLRQFAFGRLAALRVITAVPELLNELTETPALTSFVAMHATLRGAGAHRWSEMRAIHEHGGLFALLDWLGLPATRATLGALRNLISPDVPRRLLEPLRASLWQPATVRALQRTPVVSDRQLARFCHALAA
jgi:hypothetical protein